jgi:hypothetical protein
LNTGTGANGIKFNKEEQKTLLDYSMKPSIKLQNGRYITPFQLAMSQAMKDQTLFLTLAKLASNGFKIPEIEKATETKVVNKIKTKLRESKQVGLASSSSARDFDSVADLFEG